MPKTRLPDFINWAVLISFAVLTALPGFGQTQANWRGGTGNWESYNWSTSPNYPNNTFNTYYDATVGTGNGDSVTLSNTVTIDTLTLGDSNNSTNFPSTLTVASNGSLTVGVGPDPNVALWLYAGGILNVNGSLTLNAAAANNVNGFSLTNYTGVINVANGGTLAITAVQGQTVGVANYGAINLGAGGTGGTLSLGGQNAIFDLTSLGGSQMAFYLSGGTISGQTGTEELINDFGSVIRGAGTVSNLNVVNYTTIFASGGVLTIRANPNNFTNAAGFAAGTVGFFNDTNASAGAGGTLTLDMTGQLNGGYAAVPVINEGSIAANGAGTVNFTAPAGTATAGQVTDIINATVYHGSSGIIQVGDTAAGTLQFTGSDAVFLITPTQGNTGSIVLSNAAGNAVTGTTGKELLYLDTGETLSGAGTISNLTLINQGAIVANGTNQLTIKANPNAFTFNTTSPNTIAFVNDAGTLQINSGSTLALDTSASENAYYAVENFNTITANDGGTLALAAAQNETARILNSATITLGGTGAGGTMSLSGQGAIFDLGSFGGTSGTLTLSNNAANAITGTGTEAFLNDVGSTLSGAGTISNLTLLNQGSILANGTNPLIIKGSPNAVQLFNIAAGLDGFLNGSTGTVQVGSGSTLVLDVSATLNGSYAQFPVYNQNTITVNDGGTLKLLAAPNQTAQIGNVGTISLTGAQAGGTMLLDGADATFRFGTFGYAGSGSLTLSDNAANAITGTGTQTFVNDFGSTLSGAGTISNLTLVNSGSIIVNGKNTLTIKANPNAYQEFGTPVGVLGLLNAGTVQVNSGSTLKLDLSATPNGPFATYPVFNEGTIGDNGTLELAAAAGEKANIANQGTISVAGAIELSGSAASFDFGQFGYSGSSGSIALTSGSTITGDGTETFINDTGSTLSGSGTIGNLAFTNNGTVTANTLTITPNASAVINNGSFETVTGGSLTMNGNLANNLGATFNVDGGLYYNSNVGPVPELGGAGNINANVTNGGTVNLYGGNNVSGYPGIAPGASMTITGNLTNSGTMNVLAGMSLLADGGALSVEGNLGNSGDIEVLSGGSLVAYGGTLGVSGLFTNSGTLHVAGTGMGQPFDGSVSVTGAGGMTNSGTVKINYGALLQITNGFTQSAGNTNVDGKLSATSVAINGGTLSGNGAVAAATTTIGGTLMPGESGAAGLLTFTGNVALDGIFDEQIGGAGNGQFSAADVAGNLTLGSSSTLMLSFLNGFTPTAGQDMFTIMDVTGTIAGDFSNTQFMADGENWYVYICNGTSSDSSFCNASDPSVILTNMPVSTNPAPEPISLGLFGIGLAGVGVLSRRARKAS